MKNKKPIKAKKKSIAAPKMKTTVKPAVISDQELARFLRRLALTYRDPTTGNLALAKALDDLSSRVLAKKLPRVKSSLKEKVDESKFSTMSRKEVSKFLDGQDTTKSEIVALAFSRFAIPKAKLMRQTFFQARETVRAALLNEASLEIISSEARKSGGARSS